MSEVKGKDITELIAAGREKLASVPAVGGAAAFDAPAAAGAPAPAAAESKKEEKVEENEESDDVRFFLYDRRLMLYCLFLESYNLVISLYNPTQ